MADIKSILSSAHDRFIQGRNYGKENPFVGTPYEEMWNNNPYATLYYDSTFWDDVGLSNKAKDANADYERLYNEYIAGIYDQQRQDQYNSESAEVARQRQAGLNPDLLGLSGNGTDAMSAPNAGPNPALNGQSPAVSHALSFLSVIGGAVSGAQSMISQRIVNDGLRLQNLDTANSIVLNELGRLNLDSDGSDIMPAFKIGFNTGSRTLDKRLESRATSLYDSISHKIYTNKNRRELAKVRKEAFDITSSAGYSDSDKFYSELATRMANAYQEIIDLSLEVDKKGLSNQSEYYDSLNPSLSAGAINEANSRSINRDSQYNKIISIEKGLIGYIKSQAENGNRDAIELLFRIFGENTNKSFYSNIRDIGLDLDYSFNGK